MGSLGEMLLGSEETRPQRLSGRTIIVPRSTAGSNAFIDMLAKEGATVEEFPTVATASTPEVEAVEEAVAGVEAFRWVVFTHEAATRLFLDRFIEARGDIQPIRDYCRLATRNRQIQQTVEAYELLTDVSFEEGEDQAFLAALTEEAGDLSEAQLLLASDEPEASLATTLTALAGSVTTVQGCERTLEAARRADMADMLEEGKVSTIIFLSPTCVDNFREAVGEDEAMAAHFPRLDVCTMGPATAAQARALGFGYPGFPLDARSDALLETVCAVIEA